MRIITITWVSASGKTTLQNDLRDRWWSKPINFTTRPPRTTDATRQLKSKNWKWEDFTAEELDEYVFLTKEQFETKLTNWDFLEHTEFKGNYYWVSNSFPEDTNIAIVVEPNWREQIRVYAEANNISFTPYFLYLPENIQEERLRERGWNWEERLWDANVIQPSADWQDIILNATLSRKVLADLVESYD